MHTLICEVDPKPERAALESHLAIVYPANSRLMQDLFSLSAKEAKSHLYSGHGTPRYVVIIDVYRAIN